VALFSSTRLLVPASSMVPLLVSVLAPVRIRLPPAVLTVRVPVLVKPPLPRTISPPVHWLSWAAMVTQAGREPGLQLPHAERSRPAL
jgi:hypothetical protein